MRKVWVVARREYLATVATKGFAIGLVLLPILMFGGMYLPRLLKGTIDTADKRIVVLDGTGELLSKLEEAASDRNKNDVFDPALSPLGTDDEAAGHPPSTFQVALARQLETVERWRHGARMTGVMEYRSGGFPVFFVSFILAVGLILVLGIWKF